jgi:flagellar hook-associated protein 2
VQSAVTNFVNQYNQTYSMIFSKVNEHPIPNAATDADRAVGDLSGDPSLLSLLSQLRESVGDMVSGAPSGFQTMAQVGVSTGAAVGVAQLNESSIQGALTIDTDKLTAALTSNFAQVKSLFTNPTGTYASEGLSQRLSGVLLGYTSPTGALSSMINSESSVIAQLSRQKSDWDVRLANKQTALQQQFTNMETALQKSQTEGSWLSSQIAKLQ